MVPPVPVVIRRLFSHLYACVHILVPDPTLARIFHTRLRTCSLLSSSLTDETNTHSSALGVLPDKPLDHLHSEFSAEVDAL